MPQPGQTRGGRNASSSLRRMAIRREASNALQIPPFPGLPNAIVKRFPYEMQEFDNYRRLVEEWRLQVQSILDQAIMALKLDRDTTTITDEEEETATVVPSAPVTPAPSSSGPSPGNTVVTEVGYGQMATAGTSLLYSRSDHTHGTPPAPGAADDPIPYAIALG